MSNISFGCMLKDSKDIENANSVLTFKENKFDTK